MGSEDDVLFRTEGRLGRITLNRPKALNALTRDMCGAMLTRLEAWARDDTIGTVVIDAVPARAFCAGGDIRSIYESGKKGDSYAREFFTTEYRLNAAIRNFPKPYVAMIDGIAMGGGVGVSVHGSYRIVSENAVLAMPETAIGLFPDVGATYVLPRLPGELGMYIGLMGTNLSPADMLYSGLATHFVPAAQFGEIASRLRAEPVDAVLSGAAKEPGASALAAQRAQIDRVFAAGSVEDLIDRLKRESDWGRETAALLLTRSPTSLKLTFQALRKGKALDFTECQRMEYRLALRVSRSPDFYEGVRAALIDKDREPRWRPADLHSVGTEEIARFFSPLGPGEFTP